MTVLFGGIYSTSVVCHGVGRIMRAGPARAELRTGMVLTHTDILKPHRQTGEEPKPNHNKTAQPVPRRTPTSGEM